MFWCGPFFCAHYFADNYADLTNSGTLTNNGWLTSHGTLDNAGTLINNGVISGMGTIHGSLSGSGTIAPGNSRSLSTSSTGTGGLSGSGTIAPGNSAGVFTIDGHLSHDGGGHEIELGGHFNGGGDKSLTEFDWIDVTGNVELAGLLDVSLIDGFELHRGDMFDILQVGGTLTGQYDGLGEGALVGNFGGEDLFITYTAGDGNDVALYTIPEPTTLLLALLALVAAPLRVRHG